MNFRQTRSATVLSINNMGRFQTVRFPQLAPVNAPPVHAVWASRVGHVAKASVFLRPVPSALRGARRASVGDPCQWEMR